MSLSQTFAGGKEAFSVCQFQLNTFSEYTSAFERSGRLTASRNVIEIGWNFKVLAADDPPRIRCGAFESS